MGLLIVSGLISVLGLQIQLKFLSILSIGLIFIGLVTVYGYISFEKMGVLEMGSIILFYVSSVYVSKSYTALQEMDKNKKQNSS